MTPQLSNDYSKNRAVQNPTDDLIYSDGVFRDVRSDRTVHLFDRTNYTVNGVFSSHRTWEIINSEVIWDLRTLEPIRNIPSLEECKIVFTSSGCIFYAYIPNLSVEEASYQTYDSSYTLINETRIMTNLYSLDIAMSEEKIVLVTLTDEEGVNESF